MIAKIQNILETFDKKYKDLNVEKILDAKTKYIILVSSNAGDLMDCIYFTQKANLKIEEYPLLINTKEYLEALKRVVYVKNKV